MTCAPHRGSKATIPKMRALNAIAPHTGGFLSSGCMNISFALL
jgi:hypothetical protein